MAAACSGPGTAADARSTVVTAPPTSSTTTTVVTSTAPPTTVAPTTTSTTTTTTTTTTTLPPLVLGFAGDTSFTNGLHTRDPLTGVADLMAAPDLMVVNLETAVAEPDVGRVFVDKRFLFRSPPESVGLLVDAGVDVVSLANNHALDYGPDALARTVELLDEAGVVHVGGGDDAASARAPAYVEAAGRTVGFLGYSRVPCDWSAGDPDARPWVSWACPPFAGQLTAEVTELVASSDVSVVLLHGGEEGVRCPSGFMRELYETLAGLGVDLVVSGHPHVLQGIDRIGDSWIVRSTGNFAFPSARANTADSAIFVATVDAVGSISLRVEPVRVPGGVTEIPSDAQAARIREVVSRHSNGWLVAESGDVVPADPDAPRACD